MASPLTSRVPAAAPTPASASDSTRHGRSRHRSGGAGQIVLYVVLSVAAIGFVAPFVLMVSNSLKTAQEIIQVPPSLLPEHPTFANFAFVLQNSPYLVWYRNSLLVAVSVTVLTLFTSSIAGYIFAKFTFPGKNVVFVVLLSTMMIPAPVLLIPSYLVMNFLHLLNTLWALVVGSIVSAFGIFLMRQFIAAIPDDLVDAARLDGAGEFAIYWRVILPLTGPALAALGIFTFLGSWNDYLWPLIVINDQDKMVVPLALTYFNSQHAQRSDLVMAAATMAVVPVCVVFLFFQRRIVNAFVLTGIK
ncbi:carbohydrate ABC transporter permease [Actinopolymorpha singaporensis]|uniref:Carbohydrate ABC transporter membrane protein 2, CUT1 family n=1 Tax=Actinopolymorpha singaporensis TaxID=117157 RepID=A0A1H1RVU3_9ACTN|nr:carbohydrate ABC transporter permease [Actinopolymorpha singaporensis]SDS39901.1 carbohydrate ABC transporter membrane protein 2, CUT1 family [Actinopolymorpha singaporensis]